jgi:hypothetical protein
VYRGGRTVLSNGHLFPTTSKSVWPVEPSDFYAMALLGLVTALPLVATVMPVGDIVKGL